MTRIIIEVKGGAVYGVTSDQPVEVTILDYDAAKCGEQGAGTWDADTDPAYVEKWWVGSYEDADAKTAQMAEQE